MKKDDTKKLKRQGTKKMECSNVSRRGFLKAGFGLGAVATTSGLALNLTKGEAHAAGPVPKNGMRPMMLLSSAVGLPVCLQPSKRKMQGQR